MKQAKSSNKNQKQKTMSNGQKGGQRMTKSATPSRRATQRVAGRGDYYLPGTFANIGRALGSRAGGFLGERAGSLLSTVSGMGDYQVNDIVNTEKAMVTAHPRIYEFTNEELVQVVRSPGTSFTSWTFANNPGLTNFPWLSAIAQRYNKYKFTQLVYHFDSTSSEYASGSGLGTVAIATNYDAADRAFSTMAEMEATAHCVSGKPSVNKLHGVECAPSDDSFKWRYVRSAAPPASTDVRVYDHSDTTLATEGLSAPAGVVIGRLKVFYTVQFTSPIALGIPPVYMPDYPATRAWYTQTAALANSIRWGVPDDVTGPTFTTAATDVVTTWVNGGATASIGGGVQPIFDIVGSTLKICAKGTYRITATFVFSTAPSGSFGVIPTPSGCTLVDAIGGAGTLWSADRRLATVNYIVAAGSATIDNPATIIVSKSSDWGATYVISQSYVTVSVLRNN